MDLNSESSNNSEFQTAGDATSDVKIPSMVFDAEPTMGSQRPIKESARRSDAFYFIKPQLVFVREDLNVRLRTAEYDARVRAIADDMKVNGFRQDRPLTAFVEKADDGTNMVILADGHTRFEAVALAIKEGAEISEVVVCLLPKSTSMVDVLAGLVKSNEGQPLLMFEQSIVVKRLQGRGMSNAEIGRKLERSAHNIDQLTILASAPARLQRMVIDGLVAATTVIDMIRSQGAKRAERTLTAAISNAVVAGKKTRVSNKHIPEKRFESRLKLDAPKFYAFATDIEADPNFKLLSEETRASLQALLAPLHELRKEFTPESADNTGSDAAANGKEAEAEYDEGQKSINFGDEADPDTEVQDEEIVAGDGGAA